MGYCPWRFVGHPCAGRIAREQSLQESETQSRIPSHPSDGATAGSMYRLLLETMADGVLIVDLAGAVADANRRGAELMRATPETIRNRRVDELLSDGRGPVMARALDALGKEDEARFVLAPPGATGDASQLGVKVRRMQGGGYLCFFLNAGNTAGALPEEVSTAIGKISHDLENLLTPLYSYPEMVRKDLPANSRGARLLDVMEKTAKDMGLIAQRLVALSKSGRSRTQVFSINGPVRRVADLVAHDADSRNIKLSLSLEEDLLSIKGAPEQVLRLVQNLCKNAMDAISESGRIDMETRNIYVDTGSKDYAELKSGEYVRLRISDTGPGIPDEIREKIFDPFFTTKGDKGKGSGLGLSVVKDVMNEHKGAITVTSRPGLGATFELFFPACRQDVPATAKTMSAGGLAAVVADDDPAQREIISKLLACHGYSVRCFQSGEEVVESFAQSEASRQSGGVSQLEGLFPDVVFLDEEMGAGMDGRAACERIVQINPAQHVVMMSAQPVDVKAGEDKAGPMSRMGKPLTWSKMESALQILRDSRNTEDESSGDLVPCSGGRILIVDDEEGISKLFDMILSAAFPLAHTETCGNGKDAVELFRKNHHAVILMDLHMPVMDGQGAFSGIQAFCEEAGWKMPSVIFCTGFAPPGAVERIVNDDAKHGLLTKPVSREELIGAVKRRLSF